MLPLVITGRASKELKAQVRALLVDEEQLFSAAVDAEVESGSAFVLCIDAEDSETMEPLFREYHGRFVWSAQSSMAELVAAVRQHLDSMASAQAHKDKRIGGAFISTRGACEASNFLDVVREGLASDGGLYILKKIPTMPKSQVHYFCKQRHFPYAEAASMILEQLVDASLTPSTLYALILQAYDRSRWSGEDNICPLTPLLMGRESGADTVNGLLSSAACNAPERWAANTSVMELFHGPTAAFKDFALQLFPRYFGTATATQTSKKYVILAATSGDTGVAAISGFVNAGGHSQVMVLYPMHGVSPVQQTQMLSFDDGTQVRAYAVDSNFDFCQRTVKELFSNTGLRDELAVAEPTGVRLSSANSINWGRLIPQVVYYFWAYRHHVQHPPAGWVFGDPIDVVVPCGNFGNILSGYIAKIMGLPIRKFVVASNQNDVLYSFVKTGTYDMRNRTLAVTSSPSIDILKASNVERFIYLLSDGDTGLVKRLMHELDTNGVFTLPDDVRAAMQSVFTAGRCSEEDCAATIKSVFELSGGSRLLDPHTAVAVFVARQFREEELLSRDLSNPTSLNTGIEVPPLVIASTAHWAKFPAPVLHSLRGEGAQLGDPAPSVAAAIQNVRAVYEEIQKAAPKQQVHPALLHALGMAEKRAKEVRAVATDVTAIEKELREFARC
ncbi:threonine synthase, putative [Leishmania tarentolae]|uniref:Threonine synthase, putative n=1 Tax=Leishmania tarentolae TaxID=5689 RepID=A0A640KH33_LEITA|nr:threonine synthase, putative [Leishmania tarentolae]